MKSLFAMIMALVVCSVAFAETPDENRLRARALIAISISLAQADLDPIKTPATCRCGDACPAGGDCASCACAAKARTVEVMGVSACASCPGGVCAMPAASPVTFVAPTVPYQALTTSGYAAGSYASAGGSCASGSCGGASSASSQRRPLLRLFGRR
jgi:hypothetical protein